jgi:hypothetical protein
MKIRAGVTGLAVAAAALLALSTPVREASSTAATAPTPAQNPAMLISTQVSNEHRLNEGRLNENQAPAAGGDSASLVIREAHSDGGYSYWPQAESRVRIQAAVRTAPPKL